MKNILLIFAVMMLPGLFGCHSSKRVISEEKSVTTDSISERVTRIVQENAGEKWFSLFSADSLGFRFSADSIRVGDTVTYYKPVFMGGMTSPNLHRESDKNFHRTDSVSEETQSVNRAETSRSSDIKEEVKGENPLKKIVITIGVTFLVFFAAIIGYRFKGYVS